MEAQKLMRPIPATSVESDAFGKDLKRRGFSFVGLTLVCAHMQAVGMANDHLVDYFRYREIRQLENRIFSRTKSLEALKRDKFVIFSAQH